MKKRLTLLLLSLLSYRLQAHPFPKLRQFVMTDRIEAEIRPLKMPKADSRPTGNACCAIRYGNYQQLFSDRNHLMGTKDNTGIKIDLGSGTITSILTSWGGGRETYQAQVQSNGKLLISANTELVVIVSLEKKGQTID